ncbi:putative kinesin [Mycena filopes]|nr:putative kinesin [Mycena filopes]
MSIVPPSPAAPKAKGGKTLVLKTDWLGAAITVAENVNSATELIPFPYVKGVSEVIVRLLKAVEQVNKNREDLKELCDSCEEIASFLHTQIVRYGNTAAIEFKSVCEELESYLEEVVLTIQTLQNQSKGFRRQLKTFLKSKSITDKISEYQKQIEKYRSKLQFEGVVEMRFQMNEIYSSRRGPNVDVVQTTQNINMCPPPSRIFHGRQIILDHMHQFFTGGSEKQLIYALYGLGGIGKTQTACKFIQDSSAHFTSIFLVDASTPETIESGLKTIAKRADSLDAALDWFKSKHENWLLFFDNADDPGMNLNKFIPKCSHGNIVITSRNPGIRVYGDHSLVSDMEEVDAINLLLQSAKTEDSEANLKTAADIVKELCYLPLAIVQAGAFISESEDLSGYLALYHKNRTRLLRISEDLFSNASRYSFPQWKPSREEVEEPLKFLSHFVEPTGEWDPLRFLAVTNEIKAYSLISFDFKSRMFSIHPLVHGWSRSTLVDEESCQTCISSILGMAVTEVPDTDIQQTALKFIPHLGSLKVMELSERNSFQMEFWRIYHHGFRLQEAREIAEEMLHKRKVLFGEEHETTLDIMGNLAMTYRELGEYKRAEELQTVALDKQTEHFGRDHPNTVLAMANLASTYSHLGEYKRAEELETVLRWGAMANLASTYSDLGEYKRAEELETVVLEKRTKLFGEDHPATVRAMASLASTYRDLGEHKRAEELETVVLEKQTEHFGGDHPNTVQAMANLAATYSDLGEYKRAEELQTMVLQKRTKLFGEDHPNAVQAMANLALTYRNLGEYQRSEELQTVVLEKQTKLLGGDHPATVGAMANLASTYSDLGEYKRAEKLKTMVLEKRTKLFGEDHPATVKAMANLAATYSNLGEYKRAEELETVVLEKGTRLFGEDHPNTVLAMGNLASTYRDLGGYKRAEELETVVLEKQTEHFGGDHPDTVLAMANLALTYRDLGEYKRAEELQTMVLQKRTKLFGKDHPDTVLAMANLASMYRDLGEYKRAEELQTMVLQKRTKLFGEDHPATVGVMANLAATYHDLGEYKRAEELETVVLEKQTEHFGGDHPDTVLAMANLASTYSNLGEYKRAEELETVVLEKRTKLFGEDHPATVGAMANLASTYRNLGEYKRAEELGTVVLEKWTKLLGENHPDTVRAMGNLASTYSDLGEYKKAQELSTVVLEKRRKLLGNKHPHTIRAMQNLVSTYKKLGNVGELGELEQLI